MAQRWTPEEDSQLRSIYVDHSRRDIQAVIDKPWTTIKRRARRLRLQRREDLVDADRTIKGPRKDAWTPEEDRLLLDIYPRCTKVEILEKLDRNWRAIWSRAYNIGLRRDQELVHDEMVEAGKTSVLYLDNLWSQDDDDKLRDLYSNTPREELLKGFNRTWRAIRKRANILGYRRDPGLIKKENVEYQKIEIMKKYGVPYTTLLPEMKEKTRQTNLLRRGVEYPMQSPEVQKKSRETVREHYGVDYAGQSEEIKERIARTNTQRYGAPNPLQNPAVMQRVIDTTRERYGVDNAFQMVDRVQAGMLEKFGQKTPLRVPEIVQRKDETNLKRYGVKYPHMSPDIQDKITKTNRERYGADTPFESAAIRKKIADTCAKNGYSQSTEEIAFLEELRKFDPDVKHHEPHPVLGFIMDYYMPAHDLWVQFDGIYWHGKNIQEIPEDPSPQMASIIRAMVNDSYQNAMVPNLIRFWSDDVSRALKKGTVHDLVSGKISENRNSTDRMCHQFKKKMEFLREDLEELSFNPKSVKASMLSLAKEDLTPELSKFIKKYEWLGNIGVPSKWCFTARYEGLICGVVMINEPSAYSKLLGDKTPIYEALIQRGATASWAPRNAGSRLLSYAFDWMVKNTSKRLFVGYSDPEANELGYIYQACNFEYLGDGYGSGVLYRHPSIKKGKTYTSHSLYRTSSLKRWCRDNGVEMQDSWFKANGFKDLSAIPVEIKHKWYGWCKEITSESEVVPVSKKKKYVLLVGRDRRELRTLTVLKSYKSLPYPKK